MPPYKPLLPYFDAVKDLLAKYDTLEFNPKKGDALLEAKGFKKNGSMWEMPDGKPFTLDIIGFGASGSAMGPVLSEILRRHGVTASLTLPPDFNSRFQKGQYAGSIYGHGGSIREPYDTLRLYQSQSIAVPGAHAVNFSRWKNPDFDKIVDEVYVTDPKDVEKLKQLFRAAMEIWLPDLPDIQLVQNYHRIPIEHDLLAELSDRGQFLCQRRVVAPDVSDRAVEPASRREAKCTRSISSNASGSFC